MRTTIARALNGEPNVIPMIDILLVLLITFMLSVAPPHDARTFVDVQLPDRNAAGSAEIPLVITVEPGPVYAINRHTIRAEALRRAIGDVLRGRPRKIVYVSGDRSIRYQDIVTAFDAARGAGAVVGVIMR